MSSADEIAVELVAVATDDVRALIGELDLTLLTEYPPEQRHGLASDPIFKPNIRFFLARLEWRSRGVWQGGIVGGLRRSRAHVRS